MIFTWKDLNEKIDREISTVSSPIVDYEFRKTFEGTFIEMKLKF